MHLSEILGSRIYVSENKTSVFRLNMSIGVYTIIYHEIMMLLRIYLLQILFYQTNNSSFIEFLKNGEYYNQFVQKHSDQKYIIVKFLKWHF
jgi:hypothetical protein